MLVEMNALIDSCVVSILKFHPSATVKKKIVDDSSTEK